MPPRSERRLVPEPEPSRGDPSWSISSLLSTLCVCDSVRRASQPNTCGLPAKLPFRGLAPLDAPEGRTLLRPMGRFGAYSFADSAPVLAFGSGSKVRGDHPTPTRG